MTLFAEVGRLNKRGEERQVNELERKKQDFLERQRTRRDDYKTKPSTACASLVWSSQYTADMRTGLNWDSANLLEFCTEYKHPRTFCTPIPMRYSEALV